MHNIKQLNVYSKARENLRAIRKLGIPLNKFGDVKNQIERAAISVVSNIAEGAGSNSPKQCLRFFSYARASNNEIQAQLDILCDIGMINDSHPLIDHNAHLGAMLTRLMRRVESG